MLRAGWAVCGSGSSRTGRAAAARKRAGIALDLAGLPFMVPDREKIRPTIGLIWLTNRIGLSLRGAVPYMPPSFRPVPKDKRAHVGQTRRHHYGKPVGLGDHASCGRDARRTQGRLR